MNAQRPSPAGADRQRGPKRLLVRTLVKAWNGNLFSEAAEAAFWQVLSLPPLLLGLLGILGHVGDLLGPQVVTSVQERIIGFCKTIFTSNVVNTIIEPTVADILTKSQAEVASVGFLLSLWAGSSAMASFVDAITVAYGQYGVRNDVWQRIFALLLYLVGLILAIIGLPLLALGPNYLPQVFPSAWRPTISTIVGTFYYPVMAVLLVVALATLYKVALPRKLPWYRGVPGAVLAMVVFLLSSVGLRIYLTQIGRTGYTYGALAAPIAFLLYTYFIGIAIVIGAHFNSAIQEMWPARTIRRKHRWRRLDKVRAAEGTNGTPPEAEPTPDPEPAPQPEPALDAESAPQPSLPEPAAPEPEPERQEHRA